MNRALPGWAIDLIRDGVHPADLGKHGDRAIWRAVYRLSVSANQRGWDAMELRALIEDKRSKLGHQITLKDGRRPRTHKQIHSLFTNSWDRAHIWLSERPDAWNAGEVAAAVAELTALAETICDDPEAPLLDSDRAVLAHAADQARTRGMLRIALPWRAVEAATGLGQRSIQKALTRLDRHGLLVLDVRGSPGQPGTKPARASLYRVLPAGTEHPYLCRGTRPMGPPAGPRPRPMGPPTGLGLGTPGQDLWDPLGDTDAYRPEEVDVTEAAQQFVSLDPTQLDALLEAIRALRSPIEPDIHRPALRVVGGTDATPGGH